MNLTRSITFTCGTLLGKWEFYSEEYLRNVKQVLNEGRELEFHWKLEFQVLKEIIMFISKQNLVF